MASGAMLDRTMIPAETIAQVAAANDIVDIIGDRLQLKRAGSTYKALCPFHREKSPSFTVTPALQIFHCFGCGVGGTVFKFLMLLDNKDFPTVVRELAERAHIAVAEDDWRGVSGTDDRVAGDIKRRLLALHTDAAAWFHRTLMKSPQAAVAREYLQSRGLNADVAARWQLGYAPASFDACLQWGTAGGYRPEELTLGGLLKTPEREDDDAPARRAYDRFRDRLMFPICNEQGAVIAFSGRVLDPEASPAKYINSPETPLFIKGNVLFGLHMTKAALLETRTAVVCEGQIDLITAFEAGVKNVVASQGTAFTEKQAILLGRKADEVVLCFDADSAGQQAAERSLTHLLEANLSVRVAMMPPGEDPDSLIRRQGAAAFQERIAAARDFFDFQIERLASLFDITTPRGKTQYIQRMAESVSLITDHVLQEAVVGKVTARLGLAPADFRPLLKRRPRGPRRPEADLAGPGLRENDAPAEAPERFARPPNAVAMLLKLSLEHEEARAWLRQQPWPELLPHIGGAELLLRSLEADLAPANAASVSAFLTGLPGEAEAFISGLLQEKSFPQPMAVVRDGWRGLEKGLLKERRTALESRMRLPELSIAEQTELQKEILDLQQRLQDIAQP
jgi:DNA primase